LAYFFVVLPDTYYPFDVVHVVGQDLTTAFVLWCCMTYIVQ